MLWWAPQWGVDQYQGVLLWSSAGLKHIFWKSTMFCLVFLYTIALYVHLYWKRVHQTFLSLLLSIEVPYMRGNMVTGVKTDHIPNHSNHNNTISVIITNNHYLCHNYTVRWQPKQQPSFTYPQQHNHWQITTITKKTLMSICNIREQVNSCCDNTVLQFKLNVITCNVGTQYSQLLFLFNWDWLLYCVCSKELYQNTACIHY